MRIAFPVSFLMFLLAVSLTASLPRPAAPAAPRPMAQVPEEELTSIRIMFGESQAAPRSYDGSIQLSQGRVVRLIPYRFFRNDAVIGPDSWRLTTKRVNFENRDGRPSSVAGGAVPQNIVPAGITAVIAAPERASLRLVLPMENIEFRPGEIGIGDLKDLMGDIILQKVPTVSKVNAESTGEQHDYPALLETRNGETWYAWQAYKDRGDQICVRRKAGASLSDPERLTDGKGDLLRTALGEDSAGRIHVVWSERSNEDWNLVERRFDGRAWSVKTPITSGRGNNIHHRIVGDSRGILHMVWTAHEGGKSYVAYSRFAEGSWSRPRDVSGFGAWAPDIAADTAGNSWVAWDSSRAGNYDIYLRRIDVGGELGEILQATKSPRFQAHPSVAVDKKGRPWLAWDESGVNWGKDWTHDSPYRSTVLYTDRTVAVSVLDAGEWKHPSADPNASVPPYLRRFAQLPKIQFDAAGRLWMMFQCRTGVGNNREDYWASNGRWDFFLTSLEGDRWRPASMLDESSSRVEGPFELLPATKGGVRMAWATDNRPFMGPGAGGFAAGTAGQYEIYASYASDGVEVRQVPLEKFSESETAGVPVHPAENADVERVRAYRIRLNGAELRILRGDFHRHTDISADGAGDGSVEDYYRYMIDAAQMDTGIISDHNMGGDVEYNWWRTEKSYDVHHIHDGFTPLFGYERSVAYPNGHRNIVFDHRGVRTLPISSDENQAKVNSGPILYPYLRQNRGICMEHSLATDQGTDWRDNDPELEPLVEIYQGYHANYEYEGAPLAETANYVVRIHGGYRPAGFFWNALAKGLKLGVQSSSDHISTHTSYAMIYTPSSSRTDIVQAMRERHVYAATDNIILDVQARDGDRTYMMGDIFEPRAKRVQFRIKAVGTDVITRLDIIKNNTFAFSKEGNAKEMTLAYSDESPRPGENYYYIRVQQIDRNMAWSSPIWLIIN